MFISLIFVEFSHNWKILFATCTSKSFLQTCYLVSKVDISSIVWN